ncbi:MAG: 4Fe-4S binding protein [Anaerolineales bacterium]|nr:4Fe-4S binding protein [Anaerolineales bacterium]
MKLGAMFGDVAGSLFRKPVTQLYPKNRQEAPSKLRGCLDWNPEKCTGCGICAMDCPANAIEVIVIDKKEKRFVLQYHIDRCTFCAQCVHSCMHGCLEMSSDVWELAAMDKDHFTKWFGETGDIQHVLAECAE